MKRQFASTELYALENNDLAIEQAIEQLKARLRHAPAGVAQDVLSRCKPETHAELMEWLAREGTVETGRVPRQWSPKRNVALWLLYHAADLTCPTTPPRSTPPRSRVL